LNSRRRVNSKSYVFSEQRLALHRSKELAAMIHPSGTFEYQAEFTAESFRNNDIVLRGVNHRSWNGDCFVGHNPTIRFWNDRLVLVASGKDRATCRNASFPIGDTVHRTALAGDRLYVIRTGAGGLGMTLLRGQKLILATGAIVSLPLGTDIQVACAPANLNSWKDLAADTWLEFRAGKELLILREREAGSIGDYDVYVERCCKPDVPGIDEYVSLSVTGDSAIQRAAMRAVILVAFGRLKLTDSNCEERFLLRSNGSA
jgi:hypothetical protein